MPSSNRASFIAIFLGVFALSFGDLHASEKTTVLSATKKPLEVNYYQLTSANRGSCLGKMRVSYQIDYGTLKEGLEPNKKKTPHSTSKQVSANDSPKIRTMCGEMNRVLLNENQKEWTLPADYSFIVMARKDASQSNVSDKEGNELAVCVVQPGETVVFSTPKRKKSLLGKTWGFGLQCHLGKSIDEAKEAAGVK